jgi:hypothetical protein
MLFEQALLLTQPCCNGNEKSACIVSLNPLPLALNSLTSGDPIPQQQGWIR